MVDYYKEACRALENSETASLLGKIQKDWKKLVQMKIYYFAAVAHVSGETNCGGCLAAVGGTCPLLPPRLGLLTPAVERCSPQHHRRRGFGCSASCPFQRSPSSEGALTPLMRVFLQLHMGKQAEEQQKFGERVSRAVSAHLIQSGLWIVILPWEG